jgi:cytoskeletal protein CcmA (bactofilin family)
LSKIYDDVKNAEDFRRSSHILAGLRIKGEISGNEDVVVDGTIHGLIQLTDGTLTVGEKGKINGDVTVRETIVHGSVLGNMEASARVEIKSSASVVGNVTTPKFMIGDGAYYKGLIEIGTKTARAATTTTK